MLDDPSHLNHMNMLCPSLQVQGYSRVQFNLRLSRLVLNAGLSLRTCRPTTKLTCIFSLRLAFQRGSPVSLINSTPKKRPQSDLFVSFRNLVLYRECCSSNLRSRSLHFLLVVPAQGINSQTFSMLRNHSGCTSIRGGQD